MKKVFTIICFVIILLFSACGKSSLPVNIEKCSPKELVDLYYKYLSEGNLENARLCLSDEYLKVINADSFSDLNNIEEISEIKIDKEEPIELYGENFKEVQVVAEFYAKYKDNNVVLDGNQIRFIYVGQATKDSSWKIISIGTGP